MGIMSLKGGFFNEITNRAVGFRQGGRVKNRPNPLSALFQEIQQYKKLLMGSLIFKTHSINYAVSLRSTHYDTRSYDIISVFLLKAFRHPMGDGYRIIESFVVLSSSLFIRTSFNFFCLSTKGSTVDILYRVPLPYSLIKRRKVS